MQDLSNPNAYTRVLLGVELLIAVLCATRLLGGWRGDFDQWLALMVLPVALVLALREALRL